VWQAPPYKLVAQGIIPLSAGKAKRTLFYEQIVHTKTYERNQNEKTNKERISKNARFYGRLSISIVDTTNLQ
jgi:hypothetical protein